MKDVMIDFETFGTGKNKCLCQVGAVYFDKTTGEIGKQFKANIDAESHVAIGGQIDAPTLYWWLQQTDSARFSLLTDIKPIREVMSNLNNFLSGADRIWSHATFDFVTLLDTLKQCGIKPNFSYKAGLDIRTLVFLAGTSTNKVIRIGTHHDALDDCLHQIKYCVEALSKITANKTHY